MKFIKSSVQKLALSLITLGAVALTTSCGNNSSTMSSMVSGVQVKSYSQNGDLWAELAATFNTGSFLLAAISVPIVDPNHPGIEYGQISLSPNLCPANSLCMGGGQLSVAMNITQVLKVPTVGATLPNGTAIPIGNLAQAAVIGLPIGKTGGRAYVALGKGIAMLGVAFPFQQLNGVGQYVPGLNIFQPVVFDKVSALVGMFAGNQPGQTGIGLFVDLSQIVNQVLPLANNNSNNIPLVAHAMLRSAALSNSVSVEAVEAQAPLHALELKAVTPSYADEQKFLYRMWRASKKNPVLTLQ